MGRQNCNFLPSNFFSPSSEEKVFIIDHYGGREGGREVECGGGKGSSMYMEVLLLLQ